MSKMWFNSEGQPIEVPSSAVAWQVRRFRTPGTRGTPELVHVADGLPLFLPIDAGIEDLRRAVAMDGRYQLTPVDDHYRRIDGAAYACVWLQSGGAAQPGTLGHLSIQHMHMVARTNVDVAQLLIAQAAVLLNAAGTLLGTTEDTDVLATAIRGLIK